MFVGRNWDTFHPLNCQQSDKTSSPHRSYHHSLSAQLTLSPAGMQRCFSPRSSSSSHTLDEYRCISHRLIPVYVSHYCISTDSKMMANPPGVNSSSFYLRPSLAPHRPQSSRSFVNFTPLTMPAYHPPPLPLSSVSIPPSHPTPTNPPSYLAPSSLSCSRNGVSYRFTAQTLDRQPLVNHST